MVSQLHALSLIADLGAISSYEDIGLGSREHCLRTTVQLSAPLATPAAAPTKIERKKTTTAKRPDRQRMAANPQGFQPFHLTW
jgi:hypothetical protein